MRCDGETLCVCRVINPYVIKAAVVNIFDFYQTLLLYLQRIFEFLY